VGCPLLIAVTDFIFVELSLVLCIAAAGRQRAGTRDDVLALVLAKCSC
jgi:hypothetical protein